MHCKHCGVTPTDATFVPRRRYADGRVAAYYKCCRSCWDDIAARNRDQIRQREQDRLILSQPSTQDTPEQAARREQLGARAYAAVRLRHEDATSGKSETQKRKSGFLRLHQHLK